MRTFNPNHFLTIPLNYKLKQCGIYCIRDISGGKIYIGSSINCYHRIMSQHYYRLRKGQHSNPHLQAAWTKYGENNFEAFLVEECKEKDLLTIEQLYLDNTGCIDRDFGYNVNQFADRIILTKEQKLKISLAKKGKKRPLSVRMQISESCKKRKWSDEQRKKFIVSNSGSRHWRNRKAK